jgi:hypothetical protein
VAEAPLIGIIMGSRSDWETMRHAAETLAALGVPHETKVVSAHRTPDRLVDYATTAVGRGLKAIIAGAGGAAHLPGMAASMTRLPVLGVPVESQGAQGHGQPVVDRPDARRHSRSARWRSASPARSTPPCSPPRSSPTMIPRSPTGSTPGARRRPPTSRSSRLTDLAGMITPGSTIGIFGGGQLGRMLAIAAANLGYRTTIYAPEASGPAIEVAADWTQGGYDDAERARRLRRAASTSRPTSSRMCRSHRSKTWASRCARCRAALAIAQDRGQEKAFVETARRPPCPVARGVETRAELDAAIGEIGAPAILKTPPLRL